MNSTAPVISPKMRWAGYVMSGLPTAMLLFSAAMKFVQPKGFEEGLAQLGLPVRLAVWIGVVELGCTLLYLVPRTAILGVILLTGYLGGAVFAHVRVGDAFIGPILFGVLLWGGLWMRDLRVRELIPLRQD